MAKNDREGRNGGTLNSGGNEGNAKGGGRRPKVFSEILKTWRENGYEAATPDVVADVYRHLLALPIGEVMLIAGDPKDATNDLPVMLRVAARDIIGKNGSIIIREILDRANGKPKQAVEHSGSIDGTTTIDPAKLTTEQKRSLLSLVEKAK